MEIDIQSWSSQVCRDRENKRVSEREIWYIPESKAITYYFDLDFKPRLPGSQLLSKEHRQKEDQVTSWWNLILVLLPWFSLWFVYQEPRHTSGLLWSFLVFITLAMVPIFILLEMELYPESQSLARVQMIPFLNLLGVGPKDPVA